MKELRVKADTENLLQVQSFINDQLEEYDCPMLTQTSIGIAVEELFVNICNYAYAPENRITKQGVRKARLFG